MNKNEKTLALHSNERLDNLHRNGYKIIQNIKKFCFGMDAVLLSSYAKVLPGEKVLDLGTGTGVIPILLEAKTKGALFQGLELQEDMVKMARRSVEYNNLQDKIEIIQGNIKGISGELEKGTYDVITCNPPYMTYKHGQINADMDKAIARHEIECTLEDVISEASQLLKQRGRLYLIHRPFRMAEIISQLCKYNLEPKKIRLVHPFVDKEPNMLLIEAIKGAKPRVCVEKPLIIYKENNKYTQEVYELYGAEEE